MMLVLTFLLALSLPQAVFAYVDPGTTTSVFGLIATIVSGAGVIAAFLIRPILRVFRKKKPGDVPTSTTSAQSPAKNDVPPTPPVV